MPPRRLVLRHAVVVLLPHREGRRQLGPGVPHGLGEGFHGRRFEPRLGEAEFLPAGSYAVVGLDQRRPRPLVGLGERWHCRPGGDGGAAGVVRVRARRVRRTYPYPPSTTAAPTAANGSTRSAADVPSCFASAALAAPGFARVTGTGTSLLIVIHGNTSHTAPARTPNRVCTNRTDI